MRPLSDLVDSLRQRKSSTAALVSAPWMFSEASQPDEVLRRRLGHDAIDVGWSVVSVATATDDDFDTQVIGGVSSLHEIVVIKDFEGLSTSQQCDWFVRARRCREQRRDGSVQFVFAGAWTPCTAASEWRRSASTSPPLNRDRVFWSGEPIQTSDLDWTPGDGVPNHSMREFVRDHFRDDWQLLGLLEAYSSGVRKLADLERFIFELPEREEAFDLLADRLRRVDDASRHVLRAVLEFGVVRGEEKEIQGLESLVVNGLVTPSKSVDKCWEVRPVVDSFIRTHGQSIDPTLRVTPHTFRLFVSNQHLRAGAFLVSQIENLLRNLIVEWYAAGVANRSEAEVFQDAPQTKESDGKVRRLLNRLDQRRATDGAKSTHSTMNHDPLAAYMDIQDIQLCLQKEPLLSRAREVFGSADRLIAFLSEFSSYRNAVAHNKDISVVLVERLVEHHEKLLGYLGRGAAKSTRPSADRLARVDEGSVKLTPSKDGLRLEFELEVGFPLVLDLVMRVEVGDNLQDETIAEVRGPRHTARMFIRGVGAPVAPDVSCSVRVQSGRLPNSR